MDEVSVGAAGGAQGGRIRNTGRTLLRRDFLGKHLRLCRLFLLRPGRDQNGRGAAQHDDSQHNGDRNSESPSPHNTSPRPRRPRASEDQQALSCRSGVKAASGSPAKNLCWSLVQRLNSTLGKSTTTVVLRRLQATDVFRSRFYVLLKREGWAVNRKRVYRPYIQKGPMPRNKKGREYSVQVTGPFYFPRSFSPGRESRALVMRQDGHGNKYSAGGRWHRTLRFPFSTTFITHNKGSGFPLRRE